LSLFPDLEPLGIAEAKPQEAGLGQALEGDPEADEGGVLGDVESQREGARGAQDGGAQDGAGLRIEKRTAPGGSALARLGREEDEAGTGLAEEAEAEGAPSFRLPLSQKAGARVLAFMGLLAQKPTRGTGIYCITG